MPEPVVDRCQVVLLNRYSVEEKIAIARKHILPRIRGAVADGGSTSALSMVHATSNIEKVMDESRKVATTGILHNAESLDIDPDRVGDPVHLHFMGGSTRKDGPSAGS